MARRLAARSDEFRAWIPYIVGIVAVLFTILAWDHIRQTTRDNDRLRVESAAQRAVDAIFDLMTTKVGLLRAGAGLFATSDDVSRDDFKAFVDRLELGANYPGTLGIGFSVRMRPQEVPEMLNALRQQGMPELQSWPEGQRDEYHAIVYLEPQDQRNQSALGYDMHADATRAAAMDEARDSGEVIASGKVQLVQDRDAERAGLLLYAPVYRGGQIPATLEERREELVGFVYMPLRADDLLARIFATEPAPLLDLQAYDGASADLAMLMHDSRRMRPPDNNGNESRIQLTKPLPLPGRSWTLTFTGRPRLHETSARHLAWFVLASGLALSALLFTVSMLQRRSERAADRSARQLGASESRLRESEDRFRVTFNQANAGMMIVDIDGRFLSVNQRLCEITGYSDDELLKTTFSEITHPDDRAREMELSRRALAGEIDSYSLDKRYIRKDGRVVWVTLSRAVVRDADDRVRYAVGVAQDISERRRAEADLQRHREHLEAMVAERTTELEHTHQRLRQSERMASLGTLSAGLGHDIGNLLLPIRLRLSTMEGKDLPGQFHDDLEAIRKSSEYLQQLANGLRLLALDPDDARASDEATDLRAWWEDAVPLLRNTLPRGVELFCEFPDGRVGVRLARHLLTQMVFNLVQNAGDAFRAEGTRETAGQVCVSMRHQPGEQVVRLGVTDNGPGMSDEVRRRCLEPFFTTKKRHLSTGLGLALVHGIVQKAGGSIDIDSEPGQGATIAVTLPAVSSDHVAGAPARRKLTASINLHDARRHAYVSSVLQSVDFEVCDVASPEARTNLWVLDAEDAALENGEVQQFIAERDDRRVLIIGEPPSTLAQHERVRSMPLAIKPTLVWQTARDLARELSPGAA